MIGNSTLFRLAQVMEAELIGNNITISGSVSIDTRTLKKGQIFFAIPGERVDGFDYVDQAFQAGAVACVVEKFVSNAEGPQLLVKDTRLALLQLGRFCRNCFKGLLIGLTGSCGKTSVKEMLATICSEAGASLATKGNYNNELGVPITLSRMSSEHRFAIIEIGTSNPGEIARLAHIAQPYISIITNAEAAHLKGLGSVKGVAQEKGAILDFLPENGFAILNRDSRFYDQWVQRAKKRQAKIISFSLTSERANVYASDIIHQKNGTSFTLNCLGEKLPVKLAFWGAHQVMNACSAASAALAAGIPLKLIGNALHKVTPYARRGERFIGIKGALIIDESYNANPASTRAAMDMLATCPGEKIFVLGDMGELDTQADISHRDAGRYASQCGINRLMTYGKLSALATEVFGKNAMHFRDKQLLINELISGLSSDTTVLVKGSNGMRMNDIIRCCKPLESKKQLMQVQKGNI